jgi:hypothetical protein
MYLTYEEYNTMGGETMSESTFDQLEFEASTQIDWWTFCRLKRDVEKGIEMPEAVKRCVFKIIQLLEMQNSVMLIDAVDEEGNITKGIMARQSNDGVSSEYGTITGNMAIRTIQSQLKNLIQMSLQDVKDSLGHKVLFRGLYPGE